MDTKNEQSVGQTHEQEKSQGLAAVATGSERPPLMRAYSHDEAINVAKQWMRDNYGIPRELSEESRDCYHEKLGLLIDFLWTLHPPEPSPNTPREPMRSPQH